MTKHKIISCIFALMPVATLVGGIAGAVIAVLLHMLLIASATVTTLEWQGLYLEGVWEFWEYELLSYRNIGVGRPTAHLMVNMDTSFGLIENDFTNEIGVLEHLS
jgi:hypothetical protein